MGTYGLTFAAVGLAYTGIDCAAETFRGIEPADHAITDRLPNPPCMMQHDLVQAEVTCRRQPADKVGPAAT